ncbi:MAG: tetratricopeptide repeat protein [Deltaproteobacteria bacterium]|nr:tetratricopeptide repeat protein [Deltaproteobacteria bacterium]
MKSLRAVLFALVVIPVVACGSDREVPTPTATPMPPIVQRVPLPVPVVDAVKPVTAQQVETPIAIPTNYGDALELGKQLAAKGDQSRAKEMFEAAIKLDKKQSEPHIELARLFITSGERAKAIKSANKAVKLAPESSQAYNTLGRAELARFNYENAIAAFEQATVLNPDNVWAWNNLGYVHLERKDYRKAAAALVEATSRPGATGYMFNNLGTALEQVDELDDARVAYEQGGELGSTEAKASRKRLEGVDSIIVMERAPVEKAYELREEMPEVVDEVDEESVEESVEDHEVEEPQVEAPPMT